MSLLATSLLADATPGGFGSESLFFLGGLGLVMIVVCARNLVRPGASRLCVAALMVAFAGILVLLGCLATANSMSASVPTRFLIVMGSAALLIAAIVLAIVGLVDYSRHREVFRQGRMHAWGALALSFAMLGMLVVQGWQAVQSYLAVGQLADRKNGDVASGDDVTTRAARARDLNKAGDEAGARKEFEQLFHDGYVDKEDLQSLIDLQMGDHDVSAALSSVGDFLSRRTDYEVQRWKGQLLSVHGDHEEALTLFQTLRDQRSDDPQAAYDLADAQEIAEKYSEALDLSAKFVATAGPDDVDKWHVLRGRCQMGLKKYREAREAFQAALAANPRNEDARDLEATAAGLLGQGSMTGANVKIEPVPIPAELQSQIDSLPKLGDEGAEFGSAERYRVTGYEYRAGKKWKMSNYRSYKVYSDDGVDFLSSLSIPFDPLTERVYVNRLQVFDADGKLVAEGNIDDYYVSGDGDNDLATSDHTLNVPVPQLRPGCSLEFVYTCEEIKAADEFGFENVILGGSDPVQLAAAFVVGDVEKIDSVNVRCEPHDSPGVRTWIVRKPAPYLSEPSQACLDDFMAMVYLGDKGRTWDGVGREHLKEIEDRLAAEPDVTARAKELAAGASSTEEKIARIAAFVQRELTYQGLEFGIRGQIPNRASKTLKAGYGDCKDHAVLLEQMLQAVDVPAQLALVLTEGRVIEKLPSVDQFDHMVVYLPGAQVERAFLDCTDKAGPPMASIYDCEGRRTLLLDPSGPHLIETPRYPSDGSRIQCDRTMEIVYDDARPDAAGVSVTDVVTLDPLMAPAFREMFKAEAQQDRKSALADVLREYARMSITELKIDGLTTPSDPLVITMKYRVDRTLHRSGENLFSGSLPSPWELWWADVESVERRTSPFELQASRLESKASIKLPAGFEFVSESASAKSDAKDKFVTWELTADPTKSGESRLEAKQAGGEFAAGEYARYYEEAQKLLDAVKQPISIQLRR